MLGPGRPATSVAERLALTGNHQREVVRDRDGGRTRSPRHPSPSRRGTARTPPTTSSAQQQGLGPGGDVTGRREGPAVPGGVARPSVHQAPAGHERDQDDDDPPTAEPAPARPRGAPGRPGRAPRSSPAGLTGRAPPSRCRTSRPRAPGSGSGARSATRPRISVEEMARAGMFMTLIPGMLVGAWASIRREVVTGSRRRDEVRQLEQLTAGPSTGRSRARRRHR